jgi:hypothetical protein
MLQLFVILIDGEGEPVDRPKGLARRSPGLGQCPGHVLPLSRGETKSNERTKSTSGRGEEFSRALQWPRPLGNGRAPPLKRENEVDFRAR